MKNRILFGERNIYLVTVERDGIDACTRVRTSSRSKIKEDWGESLLETFMKTQTVPPGHYIMTSQRKGLKTNIKLTPM